MFAVCDILLSKCGVRCLIPGGTGSDSKTRFIAMKCHAMVLSLPYARGTYHGTIVTIWWGHVPWYCRYHMMGTHTMYCRYHMLGTHTMVLSLPYARDTYHGTVVTICSGHIPWYYRYHMLGTHTMVLSLPYAQDTYHGTVVTICSGHIPWYCRYHVLGTWYNVQCDIEWKHALPWSTDHTSLKLEGIEFVIS